MGGRLIVIGWGVRAGLGVGKYRSSYISHYEILYDYTIDRKVSRNICITQDNFWKISNFSYIAKYDKKCIFICLIFFTFIEVLKIVSIIMIAILMVSAKLTTSGLLKIILFWKKDMASQFLPMTSSTRFYNLTQIIFAVGIVCEQSLVT